MGSVTDNRGPIHKWTHYYWPSALVVAIVLFFVPYYGFHKNLTGWGLLAGSVLLGIPELLCFITHNSQDTFSDWVWNSAHITGSVPINRWTAEHYLLACCYIFIATNATGYLFSLNWKSGLAGGLFSSWLLFHFWGRWWK